MIEKGKHITEEGIGMVDGEPGMEAIERGMVGSGTKQGQADVPAHKHVGGKVEFKFGVRTGICPGTDNFGTNKHTHRIGWGSTRSMLAIVVLTGGDDCGGIVEMCQTD